MQTADQTRVRSPGPENEPIGDVFPDDMIVLAKRRRVAIEAFGAGETSVRSARHGSLAGSQSVEIPLVGSNGEISGVMCVERNIPTAQSEPRHSVTGTEIAKVFVHDINNLLSVIGGGLNLLERQCDAATQAVIFARMRKAIARGAALSRSMLDAGKRPGPGTREITSRADLITAAETLDQALGERTDMEVNISLDLSEFNADPERLYFALLNLCRNADAAMLRGGVVSITATNIEPVPATPEGAVLITVADSGSGMSKNVLSRAFDPYFTTKAAGYGSGLGLAQVRDFVEDSGGAIRLESEPGVGTRVHMIFSRVSSNSPIGYSPRKQSGRQSF